MHAEQLRLNLIKSLKSWKREAFAANINFTPRQHYAEKKKIKKKYA